MSHRPSGRPPTPKPSQLTRDTARVKCIDDSDESGRGMLVKRGEVYSVSDVQMRHGRPWLVVVRVGRKNIAAGADRFVPA